MPIGYLPDMFGHVAQMPQLLRLAGIEHAVVWRGVPAAVEQTAFWWEAPDGSRVRCRVPVRLLLERPRHPRRREGPRAAGPPTTSRSSAPARLADMLLMNGTDHQMPQPWLGRVVAEANAMQDDYEFVVTSLAGVPARAADRRARRPSAASCARARARTC